jgi:hypothetical protein
MCPPLCPTLITRQQFLSNCSQDVEMPIESRQPRLSVGAIDLFQKHLILKQLDSALMAAVSLGF